MVSVSICRDTYSETVLYKGVTTSDGSVGKTTLVDSVLVSENDFVTNTIVIILSGDCNRETRYISSFSDVTGTISVGTAFSAQIVSGVSFAIIGRLSGGVDIDIIKADTQTIEDSTLKAAPTAGSLASFIASGGTALGTQLPDSKSLYDCVSGGVDAVNRVAGKTRILEVSVTIAANAAATTIATVTTQPCLIHSIIVHADAAQTADLTSLNVKGGASNVITFIDDGTGAYANLDAADKQVAWTGAVRLAATKTITIDPTGTGATALDLTVTIEFESCVNGGYLV